MTKKKNPRYQTLVAGMTYSNGVGGGASNLVYPSLGVGATTVSGPIAYGGATGVVGNTGVGGPVGPVSPPHTALPEFCTIKPVDAEHNICLYSSRWNSFRFLNYNVGSADTEVVLTSKDVFVRAALITPGVAVFNLLFSRTAVFDPATETWANYLDVSDIFMLPRMETVQRLSFLMHKKARMDDIDVPMLTYEEDTNGRLLRRLCDRESLGQRMLAAREGVSDIYRTRESEYGEYTSKFRYGRARAGTAEEIDCKTTISKYLREKLPQKALLWSFVGLDDFCILENVSKFYWEQVVAKMLPDFDRGERRVSWVTEDVEGTVNVLLWLSYRGRESIPWKTWEEAFNVA